MQNEFEYWQMLEDDELFQTKKQTENKFMTMNAGKESVQNGFSNMCKG